MTTQTALVPPAEIYVHASEGTKFTPRDINDDLHAAATEYAKAYLGDFSFMCKMRYAATKWGLSDGQAAGTLNSWVNELRRSAPKPQSNAAPTADANIRDGIYTVVLDSGDHRTIRIRHGQDDARDTQFVSFLSGPDNESSYTCCGYIKAAKYSWTRRYADMASSNAALAQAVNFLLLADDSRRKEFGRAYALQSGNCYVCNRTLTDPISIELGIGPICREKE